MTSPAYTFKDEFSIKKQIEECMCVYIFFLLPSKLLCSQDFQAAQVTKKNLKTILIDGKAVEDYEIRVGKPKTGRGIKGR